jgi:hypothetical protein
MVFGETNGKIRRKVWSKSFHVSSTSRRQERGIYHVKNKKYLSLCLFVWWGSCDSLVYDHVLRLAIIWVTCLIRSQRTWVVPWYPLCIDIYLLSFHAGFSWIYYKILCNM